MSSQLQELSRSLLAAGSAPDPKGEGEYLLYVDPNKSFLNCKHWTGDAFGRQELVASSVRPNSTAAYLITPTEKLIICISPSSNLSAYTYDNDECEWVESDDHPIAAYKVHPDGKLAASLDDKGQVYACFQDASQRLVYLDHKWSSTVLPATPVAGSPFSTSFFDDTLHLYYISATDNYIHDVTRKNGTWRDTVVIKYAFQTRIKAFFMTENESGGAESYALTQENALQKFAAEGEITKLGNVRDGKFMPQTTEEASMTVRYYRHGQLVKRVDIQADRVWSRGRY